MKRYDNTTNQPAALFIDDIPVFEELQDDAVAISGGRGCPSSFFNINIPRPSIRAVATCNDTSSCNILAAACESLGGVGQCGGDENPGGCQCVF